MDEGSTVNSTVLLTSFAVYTLAIVAVGLYSARYARRSDKITFGDVDVEVYDLPLAFGAALVVNIILSVLIPDRQSQSES